MLDNLVVLCPSHHTFNSDFSAHLSSRFVVADLPLGFRATEKQNFAFSGDITVHQHLKKVFNPA